MKLDDRLDQPDNFESRLRAGLDHIAQADAVTDQGRFDPNVVTLAGIGTPDRHSPVRALAAAAAVVAAVGGLALLATRDAAPAASDQPAPSPTAQPDATFPVATTYPFSVWPANMGAPGTIAPQRDQNVDAGNYPAGCEPLDAALVATAPDPYGGPDYQWWIAPTSGGGQHESVVQLDADGQTIGGGGGSTSCTPLPAEDIYWSGGGGVGGPNPMVSHGGKVSVDAASVVLTFPGQTPVAVPVNDDGYFLTVLAESQVSPESPFHFPERIDALDSDGNIVATGTFP